MLESTNMDFMRLRMNYSKTMLSVEISRDFHREYLLIQLDPDVVVCPIPSTYVEMHSPVLGPAVLRYGDDVAMMWRVATSGYAEV